MGKISYRLIALVMVVLAFASYAMAADLGTIELNKEIGQTVTRYAATDGSIAMRVKYIGSSTGTILVNAGGDLGFEDGGTSDTTVSTDGTIDVSGTSEDTMGEVCDAINASANWACVLVDVLPSHSANNVLTAVSETSSGITDEEGKALKYNTADLDMLSLSIGPEYQIDEILSVSNNDLLNRRSTPTGAGVASTWRNACFYTTATATYTTGAPDLEVYAVSSDSAGATELLLWSQAGAASTVGTGIDLTDLPPIKGPRGWRLVIVYDDDSTPDITAGSIQVHGLSYEE